MKVSRETKAATREQLLNEAARLFRERGFDGISVAELMNQVGLTHGGFYGYFRSKNDLMAQACQRAVASMLAEWRAVADGASNPLAAVTALYLSKRHRDQAGTGCLMAALGPEVARQPESVRRAVTESLEQVLGFLMEMSPGRTSGQRRRAATEVFASMVGALVISRAVNDSKISEEVLRIVAKSL